MWVVPFLVVTIGAMAIVALLRATAESARELAAEVARFGELHASLDRVHRELQRGTASVSRLRDR